MATTTQTETETHQLSVLDDVETTHNDRESGALDKGTYLRILSACFSFFVAGVNDGSLGALIPYMIRDYYVNT
ncbi:Bypass of stop codon 6, partial [Fusarium albosuccineum]